MDWGWFVDGSRRQEIGFDAAWDLAAAGTGFVWVGVHAPNMRQLTQLGGLLGLHPLAIEDAANRQQRPKLVRYDTSVFLSMRTLAYVDRDARNEGGDVVETGSIMVFMGEHFALTVRHGRHASMSALHDRLDSNPQHLACGPSAVLHEVADLVVDDYLAVVDAVTEDIEDIEAAVFARRTPSDIERIYQLKRDVMEMKRTVGALGSAMRQLADRPERLVHPEIRDYLRDVGDHIDRVGEQVQGFDELLSSILQAGLARLSVSENEDMRRISAWVAIAAVPTMIAAIYGMNFAHMPELSQAWGYPVVLLGMAGICAALYRGFRQSGWL
jgi:magnesium transporter